MELVGLGYTGWFVYRYLLFKVTLRDSKSLLCSIMSVAPQVAKPVIEKYIGNYIMHTVSLC